MENVKNEIADIAAGGLVAFGVGMAAAPIVGTLSIPAFVNVGLLAIIGAVGADRRLFQNLLSVDESAENRRVWDPDPKGGIFLEAAVTTLDGDIIEDNDVCYDLKQCFLTGEDLIDELKEKGFQFGSTPAPLLTNNEISQEIDLSDLNTEVVTTFRGKTFPDKTLEEVRKEIESNMKYGLVRYQKTEEEEENPDQPKTFNQNLQRNMNSGEDNNGFPTSYNYEVSIDGFTEPNQILVDKIPGRVLYIIENKPYSGIDYKKACSNRDTPEMPVPYTYNNEEELWRLQVSPEELKATILLHKEEVGDIYIFHIEVYLNTPKGKGRDGDGITEDLDLVTIESYIQKEIKKGVDYDNKFSDSRIKYKFKYTYHYLK